MNQLDKPNLILPLAASYNERGTAGYAATVTNGLDQRKINSLYEVVTNAVTGKSTIYLAKRPGVAASGNRGTSGQVAYSILFRADQSEVWLFSTSGSNVRASDSSGTTTIVAAAGYTPNYVDETQISGTNTAVVQLVVDSVSAQRVFYASIRTAWTEIVDADFAALITKGKMEFMDGFAFALDSANRIYNSDLNSLANWTATNYITKQIELDRPTSLAKFKNQILAFGYHTYEVFYNAGNATGSPLETIKQLSGRVGMPLVGALGNYHCAVGGKLFFAGSGGADLGRCGLYAYDGQRAEKVSTQEIDKIILDAPNIYSVHEIVCRGRSAVAIQLTATNAATQIWLMYFPDWNEWFEWNSTVFTPVNSQGRFFGVGSNQHKTYDLVNQDDTWQDDGTDYTMTHQFKLPKNGNHKQFVDMMGVSGDTQPGTTTSTLNVELSRDDYQTFETARGIDMTRKKKHITRCGSYEGDLAVRLTHTGNLECRLENLLLRIR